MLVVVAAAAAAAAAVAVAAAAAEPQWQQRPCSTHRHAVPLAGCAPLVVAAMLSITHACTRSNSDASESSTGLFLFKVPTTNRLSGCAPLVVEAVLDGSLGAAAGAAAG